MITDNAFAAALAHWLDARLAVRPPADDDRSANRSRTAGDAASAARADVGRAARLFGLTVTDPAAVPLGDDGAVRFVAVAEGEAYELARAVAPLAIHHHDALALVTEGWAAPLPAAGDDGEPAPIVRPSRDPERRRVRVTTVALDSGAVGTGLRWLDRDDAALDPGPVAGPLADVLRRACDMTEKTDRAERTEERDRSSAA
ncbi:MAG: hypothetical protein AB7Q42_10780 [Acidimicrobiia bacterium]